jgi:hypothetical protein
MNLDNFRNDVPDLFSFLEDIIQFNGRNNLNLKGEKRTIRFINGKSGYEYIENETKAQVLIGINQEGMGYTLHRMVHSKGPAFDRYDHYNLQGELILSSEKNEINSPLCEFYEMELSCPIINHFYNYLYGEYEKAKEGKAKTFQVQSIENALKKFFHSKKIRLSVHDKENDPAIVEIYNKILMTEKDPILSWEERQLLFQKYKHQRQQILKTKIRAHKLVGIKLSLKIFHKDLENFFKRFMNRPLNNFQGILYRYTFGNLIWFLKTVKNNLGYSIALAVYGPFTYYFITMPMNPHAMQAVGQVRATYLDVKDKIYEIIKSPLENISYSSKSNLHPENIISQDNRRNSHSYLGIANNINAPIAPTQNNSIMESKVTLGRTHPKSIFLGNGSIEKVTPSYLNMILTSDSTSLSKTKWDERMSNFKQMQISYEEKVEYASRIGRLEQLETQYNFPMQIEATWEELERYNHTIYKIRRDHSNLSVNFKQFLLNEMNRTHQLQLYLWDRLGRFMLDQIYVMLDEDKEQKRSDFYVGRSFILMEEMTRILLWRYKKINRPHGYEKIQKLAHHYIKYRKETGSILKNLFTNSVLFKQKNIFDTNEFREYMKRQWEILFLQNSKAEEAANMGLNMYLWSIRNTAWIIQSIFSAKREELPILVKRDLSLGQLGDDESSTRIKLSLLYETLFHNLSLEYVGIKEELTHHLKNDIESIQRLTIIENLKEFLSDREKLDNLVKGNTQRTAETKI